MKRFAIRVDASPAIGMGHLVRCATLAKELNRQGARIRFLCRNLAPSQVNWLSGAGFQTCELPGDALSQEDDAAQCVSALQDFHPDWLVVDNYQLDVRWETAMRPHCSQILVIDDLADRAHDCDVLLDQNFNPKLHERYSKLTPSHTRQLLGPRYALLRPEFPANRTRGTCSTDSVRRVLICFGGGDPGNHTLATLDAIEPLAGRFDHIDLVIGAVNLQKEAIIDRCQSLPNVHIHCAVENMAELLLQADLAIGAGGTMNWERACLGIPSLVFGVADNQVAVLEALIEAGMVAGQAKMLVADSTSISQWIAVAINNPAFLRGLGVRSKALVDGYGTERIARLLLQPPITFRPASVEDSENLLRWRNAPEIRNVSINTAEIDQATHHHWLTQTLADQSRKLLIAEACGNPVGVVRFDLDPPEACISIYHIPNHPNRTGGLIRLASAWLQQHCPEVTRIVAEVRPENTRSLSAFRAAGYRVQKTSLVLEWNRP